MSKKFYVTTPIYYANGKPHIGNSYSSFLADFLARSKRMLGYEVKFATGTDENGQKMTQKAEEQGKEVMEFLDEVSAIHKETWDACGISYTDFIRTTEPRHKEFVQSMLQKTFDNGDIYQGEYEGLYCIGCEGFKKEGDLIDLEGKKVCPDHLKEPDSIKEKNWFFKLSKYEEQLKELYKINQEFCFPSLRFNEVKAFVDQGLEDFSISREGSDFGIGLPFDEKSVTYIWFDALYNYITVCAGEDMGYWNDGEVVHVLGKDISRFHAIYRPAMLMSSGYKLPNKELVTGFFTIDGQKMGKSLGNIFYPDAVIAEHGRDALVYYLFSDIKIGNDGDFSRDRFEVTRDATLKKGRGNLVSRVVTLAKKYEVESVSVDSLQIEVLKNIAGNNDHGNKLVTMLLGTYEETVVDGYINDSDLSSLLRDWYGLVQLGNKYVDETKPWEKAKIDLEGAKRDLQLLLWLIKGIAVLSSPFLVESFDKFKNIIQIQDSDRNLLQTDNNSLGLGDKFAKIIALQEFDIKWGEGKYLY